MTKQNGHTEIGEVVPADDDNVTLTVKTARTDRHVRVDFSQAIAGFTLSRRGAEGLVHLLEAALDRLDQRAPEEKG